MVNKELLQGYLAGAISGSAGVVFGHPLDTLKCQLQVQLAENKYSSIWDCCKTVQRQSLSQGFFRGMSWPLISYGVVNSVFFGTYSQCLRMLGSSDMPGTAPNLTHICIAGSVGGVTQLSVAVPVEVMKVVLQSQIPRAAVAASKKGINKDYYRGPAEGLFDIIKAKGVRGMYRGTVTQFYRDIPASASYWAVFEFSSFYSHKHFPSINSQFMNFMAGGLAGILSWTLITPFDVIKSRVQADVKGNLYNGFFDCAMKSMKEEGLAVFFRGINKDYYRGPAEGLFDIIKAKGVRGMYRGTVTQFYRDIPASASYWAVFEFSSFYSHKHFPSINSQFMNFMAGGLAGILSWTLITPFDVIKSRVQADVKGNLYNGFFDCAMKSMKEEGLAVFFRGYVAVATRAFLVNSITLLVYVESLKAFNAVHLGE